MNILENEELKRELLVALAEYTSTIGYRDTRKYIHVPEDYITSTGFPLGEKCKEIQWLFEHNKLTDEKIRFYLVCKIQFLSDPHQDLGKWMDKADEVEDYCKEHKTSSISPATYFKDGTSMFQWVHHQKQLYKDGKLTTYQVKRLEAIGVKWIKEKHNYTWDYFYRQAKGYFEENGHLFVPEDYVNERGTALGKWIVLQRRRGLGLESRPLNQNQIDKLEEIGMFWEDIELAEWDWFVGLLREYIRKTKKPVTRECKYKNYALGKKVYEVIVDYKKGILSKEKVQDLRDIGFDFNKPFR